MAEQVALPGGFSSVASYFPFLLALVLFFSGSIMLA